MVFRSSTTVSSFSLATSPLTVLTTVPVHSVPYYFSLSSLERPLICLTIGCSSILKRIRCSVQRIWKISWFKRTVPQAPSFIGYNGLYSELLHDDEFHSVEIVTESHSQTHALLHPQWTSIRIAEPRWIRILIHFGLPSFRQRRLSNDVETHYVVERETRSHHKSRGSSQRTVDEVVCHGQRSNI